MLAASETSRYSGYTIKWTTLEWEREEAYALRRRVFCQEQRLFKNDDRDQHDAEAQLLVALASYGGWHERVVGTVRIHSDQAGHWQGSRLAVDPSCRIHGSIGSTLIRLAVSSAHALGCHSFHAWVQKQNEPLFRRLDWETLEEKIIHGRPHVLMEADLAFYPPCRTPESGYVIRARKVQRDEDLSPFLLSLPHSIPAVSAALVGSRP